MEDLVSIITPCYNCALFLPATIESVMAQSYGNWEMIVVDDCSSDNSADIVSQYAGKDPRIMLLINGTNSGAAVSRNRALQEAKGRWVAYLDADDIWMPDKLERQIRFMKEGGYAFSYTEYLEIDEVGRETGVIVSGPKRISKVGMFAFCWPGCLTVIFDREKVGLIQIADIKKNNDYAMWLKICRKADCLLLPECLAKYRRGRAGSISSNGVIKMIKWHYKLFREAESMGVLSSLWHAGINLVCGFLKKIVYVHKVVVS